MKGNYRKVHLAALEYCYYLRLLTLLVPRLVRHRTGKSWGNFKLYPLLLLLSSDLSRLVVPAVVIENGSKES